MRSPSENNRIEKPLEESTEEKPSVRLPAPSRVPAIIVAIVAAAAGGLSIWYLVRPEPLLVQGEAKITESSDPLVLAIEIRQVVVVGIAV